MPNSTPHRVWEFHNRFIVTARELSLAQGLTWARDMNRRMTNAERELITLMDNWIDDQVFDEAVRYVKIIFPWDIQRTNGITGTEWIYHIYGYALDARDAKDMINVVVDVFGNGLLGTSAHVSTKDQA